jgi:hypothetical protein
MTTQPISPQTIPAPLVTVSKVIQLPYARDLLAGAGLDLPMAGTPSEAYSIVFEGWAVGRHSAANGVEISGPGYACRDLPVSVRRPDLHAEYPSINWALNGGFRAGISSLSLPQDFELDVTIRLRDGSRAPLARLVGHRQPFRASEDHVLRPIMVNTLGRTGSTWVTALLGAHPEIVAFRPYIYEARVASYWAEILATLAEPQSYLQSIAGNVYGWDWWSGRGRVDPQEEMMHDPEIERFLGKENLEELAEFCKGRIAAFYARISDGFDDAAYLVEKAWPASIAPVLLRQFYPGTKEIFLARDPRDIAASTIAYNAKRQILAFGRETVESDDEFIRGPMRTGTEQLLESWLRRSGDSFMMRYEDLVQWPEVVLRDTFEYLGIDTSASTIEAAIAGAHRPVSQQLHQTSRSVAESVGRWKTDLPPDLRQAADEALSDLAVQFGYKR